MDLSYPPFETIDEVGKPTGVSVDLARALGDHLGRPVRIENLPFVGLIPALQSGKIDLILSSMTETPERAQSIDFSDPYLSTGLALLVGSASTVETVNDLDRPGRTIAVRQGTTGEAYARQHFEQAEVLAVEKESSAVLEVIQGKADGFIYDQMSIWKNAQMHPTATRAILTPFQRESWAIGLRQGDDNLRNQVNDFLEAFKANSGFDDLSNRYLLDQKTAFQEAGIPFYF
ncbi:MAG: transporter substrate-binding domain-containing protein [Chthoniobacterales bacterium]